MHVDLALECSSQNLCIPDSKLFDRSQKAAENRDTEGEAQRRATGLTL